MVTIASVARRVTRAVRFGRYGHKKVFEHIFDSRYWGDKESVSGMGSSLEQTADIRRELPLLMQRHDIRTLFDAPCGDLHWMRHILSETDIDYIGGDVVAGVVETAKAKFEGENAHFRVFDIIEDDFPDADMWLCRDVLFHFSYKNINEALRNFARSTVKYILVTTHTSPHVINRNIVTGDFRQVDLFKPPFNFPPSIVIDRFKDYAPPANPRDMVMISREDIATLVK
ncbi:class I SAM-dependent methyltransferase [Flavisphingomonas formosensis]|uniref:class I SAM-dependent methyltransferase n=1 Tax=Flavisphingomonas formosensis TaxID=861534 RepID=UPI0012F72F83|nr:class I SAM-dependent methyltransferase [Sphingomonas formosensis]